MKKIIAILFFLLLPFPILASTESDINNVRVNNGLKKLTIFSGLQQSSLDKVLDMIVKKYFAHVSPKGISWDWFIINKKIKGLGEGQITGGEILAKNYTGDALIRAWMASPAHKSVILDKYFTRIGCASKNGLTACHFVK